MPPPGSSRRRLFALLGLVLLVSTACSAHPGLAGAIPTWVVRPPTRSAVPYGPHSQQVLDIYLPVVGRSQGTIVYVHGGSFVGGWRQQVAFTNPELLGLTNLGWSVVTVDYRTDRSLGRIAGQVDDVRRALQWVHDHGDDYGLDTSTVVATGQSAGGTLVMLGASDPTEPWPADAWVAIAAVADIPAWVLLSDSVVPTDESLAAMSPIATIRKATTPGYVMHSPADDVVPVSQARVLVRSARSAGVSVRYDEILDTPWCHPHSATCGMDDASFLDWLTGLSAPTSRSVR